MFRPMYEHMLESEYQTAIRGLDPEKLGVDPPDVMAAVDIRGTSEKKLAAIACHASQLRDGDPLTLFPDALVRRLLGTELFELGAGLLPERRWRDLDENLQL
jgi:LmbE family N-acetylglucosaminyl deacetylase